MLDFGEGLTDDKKVFSLMLVLLLGNQLAHMRFRRSAHLISLILSIALLASPAVAQQKRGAAPRKPAAAQAPEPVPTFENLLAADSYRVYGEVRSVGQLIRSPAFNDLLDPLMKVVGPPKEFKRVVKWLGTHADALAGSRMLVASWPARPKLPTFLIAIEFASAEDAQKFEPQLRGFLPTLAPTPTPAAATSPAGKPNPAAEVADRMPEAVDRLPFQVKQSGALVLLSEQQFDFRSLKPRGSKLLAEDPNFALARNRFASESLFVYVDIKSIEKEERERNKKWEQEEQRRIETEAANRPKDNDAASDVDSQITPEPRALSPHAPPPVESISAPSSQPTVSGTISDSEVSSSGTLSGAPRQSSAGLSAAMFTLYGALFGGKVQWPEAIGAALVFEDEGYIVRTLIVNSAENKAHAVPFVPQFVSGPPLIPSSPGIFPADTNLFVAASLDYPQIYEGMVKAIAGAEEASRKYRREPVSDTQPASPFAAFEKMLGLKIRDDLLPLLGNEIALALPKDIANDSQPNSNAETPKTEKSAPNNAARSGPTPILAISVKDKEAVKRLIPKIIDSLGFKGANLLAQTEKRDETEITSYASFLSYAFIGDFLILSPDPTATRHVVDSYLNHQTLSSNSDFRNSTRWQPQQVQGQIYVAPNLIDLYYPRAATAGAPVNDKMREYMSRVSPVIDPVTYALSNEGLGPLHELRVPKSALMLMIAGMSSQASEAPLVTNEAVARSLMQTVLQAEAAFQTSKDGGRYGTLEELISEGLITKDLLQKYGYRIEITVSSNRFEAIAVPVEYGKTGRMSYFIDESGVLRGGDHGGGAATISDKPVE